MPKLIWDQSENRFYETGVDRGVLFVKNGNNYNVGVPWNGLTAVTESPSGAEATAIYADNIKYLSLMSAEEFGGTIEAYTFPDEFLACDGVREVAGVTIGQQNRSTFGFAYRTILGNADENNDYGYKIHLVYGALASPSEKSFATVNDSPEAITFSWTFTTTPITMEGYKPTSILTIRSDKVTPAALAALENIIYGSASTSARLPAPEEVLALVSGSAIEVTPAAPTIDAGNLTIPATLGVNYAADGIGIAAGVYDISDDVTITATAKPGYVLASGATATWNFTA